MSDRDVPAATILVCDDDSGVRRLLCLSLAARGYTVLEARDPAQAHALAREADTLHVLVTDISMPGQDGADLAAALVALHPGLRVLFVTGLDPRDVERDARIPAGARVLGKPFSQARLHEVVRELRPS